MTVTNTQLANDAQSLAWQARRRINAIFDDLDRLQRPIERSLREVNGWPSSLGANDGMPGGSGISDRTGSAASNLVLVTQHLDNIIDNLRALVATEQHEGYLGTLTIIETGIGKVRRIVVEPDTPDPNAIDRERCCGGKGAMWARLGAFISRHPETGADDAWGDATCTEKIHARGLCNKHYVAARRWCQRHDTEWLDRTPTEA